MNIFSSIISILGNTILFYTFHSFPCSFLYHSIPFLHTFLYGYHPDISGRRTLQKVATSQLMSTCTLGQRRLHFIASAEKPPLYTEYQKQKGSNPGPDFA